MQKDFDKFLAFRNRLQKVFRHLGRQAARQSITCYRLYDHDLPEFPFILELYGDKLYMAEYKRRHALTENEHESWLQRCVETAAETVGIKPEAVFLKTRKRKEGRGDQYQKTGEQKNEFVVRESDLQFIVNLSDYLDTGLFLDHRITRQRVREEANGKRVLNLFCYTGSFSVYAVAGGAVSVTSVDLSKTYLAWAERNAQLNFPAGQHHRTEHADVKAYLHTLPDATYDLIVMDPPTFSNSQRMTDVLDVQRDHVTLINQCMRVLAPYGVLFFSTNFTRFRLGAANIAAAEIKDITKATTPFDFAGKLQRPCFKIFK